LKILFFFDSDEITWVHFPNMATKMSGLQLFWVFISRSMTVGSSFYILVSHSSIHSIEKVIQRSFKPLEVKTKMNSQILKPIFESFIQNLWKVDSHFEFIHVFLSYMVSNQRILFEISSARKNSAWELWKNTLSPDRFHHVSVDQILNYDKIKSKIHNSSFHLQLTFEEEGRTLSSFLVFHTHHPHIHYNVLFDQFYKSVCVI